MVLFLKFQHPASLFKCLSEISLPSCWSLEAEWFLRTWLPLRCRIEQARRTLSSEPVHSLPLCFLESLTLRSSWRTAHSTKSKTHCLWSVFTAHARVHSSSALALVSQNSCSVSSATPLASRSPCFLTSAELSPSQLLLPPFIALVVCASPPIPFSLDVGLSSLEAIHWADSITLVPCLEASLFYDSVLRSLLFSPHTAPPAERMFLPAPYLFCLLSATLALPWLCVVHEALLYFPEPVFQFVNEALLFPSQCF